MGWPDTLSSVLVVKHDLAVRLYRIPKEEAAVIVIPPGGIITPLIKGIRGIGKARQMRAQGADPGDIPSDNATFLEAAQ